MGFGFSYWLLVRNIKCHPSIVHIYYIFLFPTKKPESWDLGSRVFLGLMLWVRSLKIQFFVGLERVEVSGLCYHIVGLRNQ